MHKYLKEIKIRNHFLFENKTIDLINKKTNRPFSIVAFIGENGSGKTTMLNELTNIPNINYVYLRQNSMYIGLANESYKLITGKDELFKISNNNNLNIEAKDYSKIIRKLNDKGLSDFYESGRLDHSRCGGEATKIIDGKTDYFDMNVLSSGQQEILLKLKTLKESNCNTDILILDEPETSLHPRWQKEIVNIIRDMAKDDDGNYPQMFLATHSERVLESLLLTKDVLFIRLYKIGDEIKFDYIEQLNTLLRNTSFAELNYLIFNINSLEYVGQLYELLEFITTFGQMKLDKYIRESNLYNKDIHEKIWQNDRQPSKVTHNIAAYCRNYFHHPKDRVKPTENEIKIAIELLRNIIIEYNNIKK